DVSARLKSVSMKEGDMVVYLNQPAGNLIPLMLEPHSTWSIVTERSGAKYRLAEFLRAGQEYPIYRLLEAIDIKTEVYPDSE
ncbi:MAG: hypothetical protein JSU61_00615, partial [Fidelibacterota bacterium]